MEITTSNLLWNLNDCIKDSKKKITNVKCCSIKGYFNCDQEFEDHSSLLNFTSDYIIKVLGMNGRHSRVAIGVSSLPKNSPVEIEGIFSISYIYTKMKIELISSIKNAEYFCKDNFSDNSPFLKVQLFQVTRRF